MAEHATTVWEAQRFPNWHITAKLVLQVFSTPVKTSSTSATKQIPLPSHSPCQRLGYGGKFVALWIRGRSECNVLAVKDVWDVSCSPNSFGNIHLVSVLQRRIRASVRQQCTMLSSDSKLKKQVRILRLKSELWRKKSKNPSQNVSLALNPLRSV